MLAPLTAALTVAVPLIVILFEVVCHGVESAASPSARAPEGCVILIVGFAEVNYRNGI